MAADKPQTLLRITATLDNLAATREFVLSAARTHGLANEAAYDLVLAVDEAVTNIIRHGYGEDGEGTIEVEAAREGSALAIRVRDRAPRFDPTAAPAPDLSVPVIQRPLGGLGIFMIRQSVDTVRYRPLPGGGNELTLVKHIGEVP